MTDTQTDRQNLYYIDIDESQATCPVLTAHHRAVRSNFARQHQNWQIRHSRPIHFTDESSFTESTNDRRARVWRPQGERYADYNIVEVDRYDGGSSWSGPIYPWVVIPKLYVFPRGRIMTARHRSDILVPIVRQHAGPTGDTFILLQDARSNTAQVSMTFIDDTGISVMNWSVSLLFNV